MSTPTARRQRTILAQLEEAISGQHGRAFVSLATYRHIGAEEWERGNASEAGPVVPVWLGADHTMPDGIAVFRAPGEEIGQTIVLTPTRPLR